MRSLLLVAICAAALGSTAMSAQRRPATRGIHDAVRQGGVDAFDRWLADGGDVKVRDDAGDRLLHVAAETAQLAIVRRLLAAGADPRLTTRAGWTPLLLACERGHAEIAVELIEHGSRPDGERSRGSARRLAAAPPAPLIVAADAGHARVVEVLLDRGAAPDVRDELGRTALFHAAMQGQADAVEALLARGPRDLAELEDDGGWRPIHAAAVHGSVDSVGALLARGADITARSRCGATARDLATRMGHVEVVALLETEDAARRAANGRPNDVQSPTRDSREQAADERDAAPLAVVSVGFAGCMGPPTAPRTGLVLALWPDGTLLRPADPELPGESMRVSSIGREAFAWARIVLDSEIPRAAPSALGPSSERELVLLFDRRSDRVARYWSRGAALAPAARSEERYAARQLASALAIVDEMIASAPSTQGTPLEACVVDGRFRGFVAADPFSTPWMHRR